MQKGVLNVNRANQSLNLINAEAAKMGFKVIANFAKVNIKKQKKAKLLENDMTKAKKAKLIIKKEIRIIIKQKKAKQIVRQDKNDIMLDIQIKLKLREL